MRRPLPKRRAGTVRDRAIGWPGALVAAGLMLGAPQPAVAFDLFGLFGSEEEPIAPSATALPYALKIQGTDESDLEKTLEDTSTLHRLRREPPPDGEGLVRRAEADIRRLPDALSGYGYYAGRVTVRIEEVTLGGEPSLMAAARAAEAEKGRALVPVRIAVEAGPLYTLRRISVRDPGGNPFGEEVLPPRLTRLDDATPARSSIVLAREARIVDHFRAQGHPFAKVMSRDPVVDDAAHVMDVTFTVDPGPVAGIGEVAVRGTKAIDPAVVRSFIYAEPGDPYSPKAIADMRRALVKVEGLGSVRVREGEALDAYGNLPVFVDVTERDRNLIGVSARYSTVDGPGIRATYANRNLFGGGETVRLDADLFYLGNDLYATQRKLAGIESNGLGGRLSATFVKPALGGTRNDLVASLFAGREAQQSYVADAAGGTVGVRHRFSDTVYAQVGVEGQAGRSQDALGKVEYRLVGVPVSMAYDSTDNLLDPTRGMRLTASATPYAGFLGSDPSILVAKAQGSTYYALDDEARYILAGRLGFGSISGASLADIPANIRFFAGGGGSVRGFPYRTLGPRGPFNLPVGGRSLLEASFEARIKVTDTIGVVPFFDAGTAFAGVAPRLRRAHPHGGGLRPALLYRHRPDPRRPRRPPRPDQGQPRAPGCPVHQPRAVVLMGGWKLFGRAPSPLPTAGEGGPRSGSGEGSAISGQRAPLSRPALTRGAPSPAEGGGPRVAVAALLIVLGLAAPIAFTHAADEAEKTVLGGLLSRALSTPSSRVAIGAVDGALSSDATIRDVAISDRDGVWLKLDRARIVWRRLALLSGRLEVDSLEVGRLDVLRRPVPAAATTTAMPEPDGTLLPQLPVKVEIKDFSLADLVLGDVIAGQPARLSAKGRAKLGAPSEGLDLDVSVQRRDAGGAFGLRLLFVPKGERLDLKAVLTEPAGGLLSKGLNVPGSPAIALDLDGTGTLDAWNARLDFSAGDDIGAKGSARIARAGPERRLTLDLGARVEGLLPGPAAAVFSGATKLDGALAFADGGGLRIDRFELTSRTARLEASGSLDAARNADFTLQARAVPTDGSVTKAAASELRSLVFDGSLKGPLAHPRIAGTLKAAGLRGADTALDRVEASVNAEPADADRFALRADARVEGLKLPDPALQRALGAKAAFDFAGSLEPDNTVAVSRLHVEGPTMRADYAGRVGQNTLTGTLEAALSDIAAFSDLAGRPLAGRLSATARLSGDPARKAVTADLDLRTQGLALGQPALDRLLGDGPRVTGRLSQVYDGYAFDGARLDGARLVARLDGTATARMADARLDLDLKDLSALDDRLSGRAGLSGRLGGTLAHPDLFALASAATATALGRPVRDLRVEATLTDLTGALDGTVGFGGTIGGKPLRGDIHVARTGPDWVLDRLAASLGSVALDGRATVDAATLLADGAVRLKAGDLDDLTPLALTRLAGSLDADIVLARDQGRQDATIRARGATLRGEGIALARLDADLKATDLRAAPRIDGRIEADRLVAADQTVDTVRLTAAGSPSATDLVLSTKARGFDLDGAARLVPGAATRIEVSRFSAARGADRLALAGPAAITLVEGGARIETLTVAAGSGTFALSGLVGRDNDIKLRLNALPLALARIAVPSLALSGTLDGDAEIHGSADAPRGRYALTVARLVTPETRKAALPPIEARASGTLGDGRIGLDGRVTAGRGVEMTVSGSLPLAAGGTLALKARGTLDAALANSLLSAGGQRVAGRVAIDAGVSGTLAAPRAEGTATLTSGSFNDPLQGIRLTSIEGRATGRGDTVVLERLTAATRNGGTLRADGRVSLSAEAGFPGAIRIAGDRAELVSSPLMTAVASLALSLDGPLARTPKVGGRVDVVSIDVTVPDRLPATVQPLPGIRRINTPPDIRARLDAKAARGAQVAALGKGASRGGRRTKAAAPFDATLDVAVSAPNRIFVRGRGIDAELGGTLRVTGSSRDPVATGAFEMRRGRLSLIGQRLDFTRGRLTFSGEIAAPDLDFIAETRATDITARVAVSGPANQPVFAITSDPSLPQDEVLSRLLFKKASGSLSAFQALQLAQAVAQLSGGAGGVDVFESARKGLGLDSLDVSTGTTGGPALGASRYLSDRLSVGIKAGAQPADTGATIDYDVTRRVKIQGEAGSDGRTSVGVGAEWEY